MQYREFEGPVIAMGRGGGDENCGQKNRKCWQVVEKNVSRSKAWPDFTLKCG